MSLDEVGDWLGVYGFGMVECDFGGTLYDLAASAPWGRFTLGRVEVTGESRPLSPVLGLTREQLVCKIAPEHPGREFLGC